MTEEIETMNLEPYKRTDTGEAEAVATQPATAAEIKAWDRLH